MKKKISRNSLTYMLTAITWGAFILIHLIYNLIAWSKLPPSDEVYANGVGFQIISFALNTFPYWLIGLLLLLLVEFSLIGQHKRHE